MTRRFGEAKQFLEDQNITFHPGINEDLAATAVMGTQQVEVEADRSVDGVFAIWYGKGPGVDRAGDALKHGNAYGSSPHGGVLMLFGDDPRLCLIQHVASVRCGGHVLVFADYPSGKRRGIYRIRSVGLGAVALFRHVGGVQGDLGKSSRVVCRSNWPNCRCSVSLRISRRRRADCISDGLTCPECRSKTGWWPKKTRCLPLPGPIP